MGEKTGKIQVFVNVYVNQHNYNKNTGVRWAILPKCPSRRANQSLDGRLGYTAIPSLFLTMLGPYWVPISEFAGPYKF